MFYTVEVHTLLKKGEETKSENFSYTFNDPKVNIIENRFNAIQKCKELTKFFEEDVQGDFDSPLVAKLKGYENFGSYSIKLVANPEDGCEPYSIWGEWSEEENLDWMEGEYHGYLKKYIDSIEVDGFEVANQEVEWLLNN